MACLITGGKAVKMLKTNHDANPTNNLFSFILIKTLACLYTFSTDLPRPLSINLWIIPSQKVDWDTVTFSIRNY